MSIKSTAQHDFFAAQGVVVRSMEVLLQAAEPEACQALQLPQIPISANATCPANQQFHHDSATLCVGEPVGIPFQPKKHCVAEGACSTRQPVSRVHRQRQQQEADEEVTLGRNPLLDTAQAQPGPSSSHATDVPAEIGQVPLEYKQGHPRHRSTSCEAATESPASESLPSQLLVTVYPQSKPIRKELADSVPEKTKLPQNLPRDADVLNPGSRSARLTRITTTSEYAYFRPRQLAHFAKPCSNLTPQRAPTTGPIRATNPNRMPPTCSKGEESGHHEAWLAHRQLAPIALKRPRLAKKPGLPGSAVQRPMASMCSKSRHTSMDVKQGSCQQCKVNASKEARTAHLIVCLHTSPRAPSVL
jgi:hypothetical protein